MTTAHLRIALVFHRHRPPAQAVAADIIEWCAEHDVVAMLFPGDAAALRSAAAVVDIAEDFRDASLVVSIGGDGTMLRAIHSVAGARVPVVGVNVGYLGYLTRVEPDQVLEVLDKWLPQARLGNVQVDERMMIEVRHGGAAPSYALNEVVLEKQESGHTVRLSVAIGDANFTTYVADGLILATPTGSTAYAMSARGPILSPQLRAVLITPVSPHMLFDRSLVLDPTEEIRITVEGLRGVNVVIDGNPLQSLEPGDHVLVRASESSAHFLRVEDRPFHQILRHKFGLADR